jgi:hypothetical protein
VLTTVLVERDGRTTMTVTIRYESREARDGVLQSPMESGVRASYDRLAELLTAPLMELQHRKRLVPAVNN